MLLLMGRNIVSKHTVSNIAVMDVTGKITKLSKERLEWVQVRNWCIMRNIFICNDPKSLLVLCLIQSTIEIAVINSSLYLAKTRTQCRLQAFFLLSFLLSQMYS